MGDLNFGGNGGGTLTVPIPSTAAAQHGPTRSDPYTINLRYLKG